MALNRPTIVVFGLSLFVAGCSGGGGGGEQSTPPAPTTIPTAVPTATASPTATPSATPTPTPTGTPTATPAPTGPVTISVSASTNVHSYTIVLDQNASGTVTQNHYTGTTIVAAADSAQYFKDLNMYSPISGVATLTTCLKSASYDTIMTMNYDNSTTKGDVSCPPGESSPAQFLYADEQQIEKDMKNALGGFTH